MDEREIYARQELGGTIAAGVRPALLIVDFVNGFLDPDIFGGGNTQDAARATIPVLESFRRAGLPIVFTRIVYAEDGSDAGVWCEKAPRLRELTERNPASHVADSLEPRDGEIVLRKTQPSAFFDTPLSALLRRDGVDAVMVAGATTSGCVRATVVDAISANFRPTVIADCVGDRALGPHEASLFDMEQKYANLVSSRDIGALVDPRHSA
jgi:maleamate amidohydrolase